MRLHALVPGTRAAQDPCALQWHILDPDHCSRTRAEEQERPLGSHLSAGRGRLWLKRSGQAAAAGVARSSERVWERDQQGVNTEPTTETNQH